MTVIGFSRGSLNFSLIIGAPGGIPFNTSGTSDTGQADDMVLTKYLTGAIFGSCSTIKLLISGPPTGSNLEINNVYIGLLALSGGSYDFDGNQIEVTFSGASGFSLAAGSTISSDIKNFAIDGSRAIIIAYNIGSVSNLPYLNGQGTNYISRRQASVQNASSTLKPSTSSVGSGRSYIITQVQGA